MKILNSCSPSFGIKIVENKAFKEVVEYSYKVNKNDILHKAINNLEHTIEGDVLITHGIDKKGKHFSQFELNGRKVENTPYFDETYLDATLRCIYDLSNLGSRFKTLTGTNTIKTRTNK